jgi:antitoxin component YwqK of YwqJK toxin-antitoxin module
MLKNICTLAVLCILFTGCGKQPEATDPSESGMKYTKAEARMSEMALTDGIYRKKGSDQPFSGCAVEFFEDGSRKKEAYFLDGKLHGPQIQWYRSGKLFSVSVYEENAAKYTKEYGPDAATGE